MTRTDDRDIPFTPPMECLPVASLPDASGWVYELKLDGFRGQGIRDKSGVHLLSRNGKDFSKKFPQVCAALKEALPLGTVVDGKLVPSRCALGAGCPASTSLSDQRQP